jgi:post-segregation antitoxin (ccd killing protein)
MRITIRLPDDIGEEVKRRTDNVSAYFKEAVAEKMQKEKRRQARLEILEMAGEGHVDPDIHEINQRKRRGGDRDLQEVYPSSQTEDA